jgi:hypothetical protein
MNYTIQDLANRECAVINDGTLEELKKVLSLAFPEDKGTKKLVGMYKFYYKDKFILKEWSCHSSTDLPTQSVKDFLSTEINYEVY